MNAMEKRAKHFCELIKANGKGTVLVEWKKSVTWGLCPRICNAHGEKMAYASGCGYCKLSTVLAETLRWLGSDRAEHDAIWQTGGCGESAVLRVLATYGWAVTEVNGGRYVAVYLLERKTA